MKSLRALGVIASIVAVLGSTTVSQAATETYVAGSAGDGVSVCKHENPAGLNIGGACFTPSSGAARVTITVNDDLLDTPGFWLQFEDAAGNCIGADPLDPTADCPGFIGPFCTSRTAGLLGGTKRVRVFLDGPVFGPLDCETGATTMGTITGTFA